jgi:ABC-type branched-subunit amino acid transport system ATPase component
MSALLTISGLKGGYKEGVEILQGIDMSVNEGEAVGIIGLNGSGKSTLGKAIMNMIPFREGEIKWIGQSVTVLSTHELTRRGLAIMQQGGQVFPTLSVWENLELAFSGCGKEAFEQIRTIVPLLQRPRRDLQHQMADRLSGGQKHQLALAMTLATEPRLVILDEPSAGLSPKAVEEMYTILQTLREEMKVTIILIEQNVSKAVGFCDRSIVLQSGTISLSVLGKDIQSIETIMFKNISQ